MSSSDEGVEEELVLHCITGWDENLEEAHFRVVLESWDLLRPRLSLVELSVDSELEWITVREVRASLLDDWSGHGSECASGVAVKIGSKRPDNREGKVGKDGLLGIWKLVLVPVEVDTVTTEESLEEFEQARDEIGIDRRNHLLALLSDCWEQLGANCFDILNKLAEEWLWNLSLNAIRLTRGALGLHSLAPALN